MILNTAPTLAGAVTDFMSVVSTVLTTVKEDSFLIVYLAAPAVSIAISGLRKMVGKY